MNRLLGYVEKWEISGENIVELTFGGEFGSFMRDKLKFSTKESSMENGNLERKTNMLFSEFKLRSTNSPPIDCSMPVIETSRIMQLLLENMRWGGAGAKTILVLRIILFYKTRDSTFQAYLETIHPADLRPIVLTSKIPSTIAA